MFVCFFLSRDDPMRCRLWSHFAYYNISALVPSGVGWVVAEKRYENAVLLYRL